MPNTAHCLERLSHHGSATKANSGRGFGEKAGGGGGGGRGLGKDGDGRVVLPANSAAASWVDGLTPGARQYVEKALTVLRAVQLSILFSPVIALAPVLLQWDGGAAIWYRLLRQTLELAGRAYFFLVFFFII